MIVDSSASTRIDLAGGTLDLWPLYLFHHDAQTVNCAITLRARCTLRARTDGRIGLSSRDTGGRIDSDDYAALKAAPALRLLGCLLEQFDVRGIEMETSSDSPVGAGIAGSSALNVAVCAALARWRGLVLSDDDLLRIAMDVEALAIGVPTGVQDYRPALYGGVAAVELRAGEIRRVALDVDVQALSDRLVLAYTGASRHSGINNWDIFKRHIDGDLRISELFDRIRDAAVGARRALIAGDWPEVARQMALDWATRKQLAPGVTTPTIEALIAGASSAGARAAKVCGAGGGGCLVCFCDPADKKAVAGALAAGGAQVLDCAVDPSGLQVRVTHG
ncbi:MAG: GHMP kinase [Vicinamibacterales bacterium]